VIKCGRCLSAGLSADDAPASNRPGSRMIFLMTLHRDQRRRRPSRSRSVGNLTRGGRLVLTSSCPSRDSPRVPLVPNPAKFGLSRSGVQSVPRFAPKNGVMPCEGARCPESRKWLSKGLRHQETNPRLTRCQRGIRMAHHRRRACHAHSSDELRLDGEFTNTTAGLA
jgi:hypothetical protein